jgi:UDP-glucose 6-dehydrogenase
MKVAVIGAGYVGVVTAAGFAEFGNEVVCVDKIPEKVEMLKKMYERGIKLQVCGTCNARCGLFKNEPYFDESLTSTMQILADWVIESDKVLTF